MSAADPSLQEPRPAATLVALRDGPHGLQVLLTLRPKHLRFMGGATVFPGGAVAEPDSDPRWMERSSLSPDDAATSLGSSDGPPALAFYICAFRESFEEVGLVLGQNTGDLPRSSAQDPSAFLDACIAHDVHLDTAALVPAGTWVTPLGSPIRFSARFFIVEVPGEWEPIPDPAEVASAHWKTPSEALTDLASGSALMAPPTIEMLQLLDAFGSAREALRGIRGSEMDGPGEVLSTRLSPNVHLVLAPNPSVMTGPGTNTYVVGSDPTVVIDPAVDDEHYLASVIEAAGDVAQILVTHRHADHVGGARSLADATGAPVRAFGDNPAGGVAVDPVEDGALIAFGGMALRAIHTPGHASDHLCFLLEGTASLFSGDTILGEGTAVIAPPDGDMSDYMASLERLRSLHIDRIYPAHFRPLDGGRAVIDGYISHRRAREAQIEACLGDSLAAVEEIVACAYQDTPLHLHPVARMSALAHLEMLEKKGRAVRAGDVWRRA